jgi:hypothetical protein
VPISDDIRGVMDRLLATDAEIAEKRAADAAGKAPADTAHNESSTWSGSWIAGGFGV